MAVITTQDFRQQLLRVDPRHRDDWLDQRLGLGALPDDGDDLPAGCVPYLPSSVRVVMSVVEHARISAGDVFVDVGSGLGRAMMLVNLLTGAGALGVEVQSRLARRATEVARRNGLDRVRTICGDARDLTAHLTTGSVFFLYCPFGGERLERTLLDLRALARVRPLRLCFASMPVPRLPWLVPEPGIDDRDVVVCQTRIHTAVAARADRFNAGSLARMVSLAPYPGLAFGSQDPRDRFDLEP